MLKQHIAACLVGTVLATAPALAQTSPAPTSSPASKAPSGMSGQFITQQTPGQWRASKLVGVDAHGTDNAKIGDVREVLVNRDGATEAVVIGVGGFSWAGREGRGRSLPGAGVGDRAQDNRNVHGGPWDCAGSSARDARASPGCAGKGAGKQRPDRQCFGCSQPGVPGPGRAAHDQGRPAERADVPLRLRHACDHDRSSQPDQPARERAAAGTLIAQMQGACVWQSSSHGVV
jgi:hypothetical protein